MYRLIFFLFAITFALAVHAGPITYQGQLQDSSGPVDTQVDIVFELYEQDEGGSPIAADSHDDVVVTDGLFQVELDFGSGAFDGSERWLQVIVDGQALAPRQPITPAPLAMHALNVSEVADTLAELDCAAGEIVKWDGSQWGCASDEDTLYSAGDGLALIGTTFSLDADHTDGLYWRRGGNVGTNPASDFLGTTDDTPFEIRSGNQRALRLEPADDPDTAPNWIGGHASNATQGNPVGVTIAGGGEEGFSHSASGNFATIGGGSRNTVDGTSSTISGGFTGTASASHSTVGGGHFNSAEGPNATVGGGAVNTASGTSSTIPGGANNEAAGAYSLAAGRRAKADNDGAFVWADSTDADFGSTGPDQFLVRAGGGVSHVVGEGGWRIEPADVPNVIGGWEGNSVATDVIAATISGGGCPDALCVDDLPNEVTSNFGVIGGGVDNSASGEFSATVGGGQHNIASGSVATVGGGQHNTASGNVATVGGGAFNIASGVAATVGGGIGNEASGEFSFAAGLLAKAEHDGAFVWADNTEADFASTGPDQFLIRAGGGVGINTNSPNAALDIEGNVRVGEELTFFDNSPQRTAGPIAKAYINFDGSIGRGVNIDSVQWDADNNRYQISVTGENYVFRRYVAHVTQSGSTTTPLAMATSSSEDDLLVQFEGGSQRDFQLVIYKLQPGVATDSSLAESSASPQSVAERPSQEKPMGQNAKVEMIRRLEHLESENTHLERRLSALESLFLEDRQVAESQQ